MRSMQSVLVGQRRELLGRVLPDRLEHPVAPLREAEEALVDERLERVEVGVTHVLRRSESASAGEHGEAREQPLLSGSSSNS